MPGFKSQHLSNASLAYELGRVAWTPPENYYVALFNTLPDAMDVGGVECSGVGYTRYVIPNNTSSFVLEGTPAITATVRNAIDFDFGTPTGVGWGQIAGAGLYDAPTGGNLYRVFVCSPPYDASPNIVLIINAGALVATEV